MRAALDEHAARHWAEAIAQHGTLRRIDAEGEPYLERYELAGWHVGYRGPSIPALYLHHFVASDSNTQTHSHPWAWSASLILAGGYTEERCDVNGRRTARQYEPGDVNLIGPDDRHRIELAEGGDCWSLFLAGEYEQPWEFFERC